MSDPVKVFWCEPNGMERRWLRRYAIVGNCEKPPRPDYTHYCTARTLLGDTLKDAVWGDYDDADPRWPTCCDRCSRPFESTDPRQKFNRTMYVRPDTGETFALEGAPVGACWNAHWFAEMEYNEGRQGSGFNTGPDGRSLVVRCPDGHDWMIDSRCSNCTRKEDNTHFCWVRHGSPEEGNLHVDKNGDTCSAGAGSIQTKNWHGYLHNGFLHT